MKSPESLEKVEKYMKYFFRGALAVAAIISTLLLITSCGKETIYVVEKAPDTTVEIQSGSGGYSDNSEYPLTSAERDYISGVDDLVGETLNLPPDQLIAVGYGICSSLRDGALLEDLYLGLLDSVGSTDSDIDFVSSVVTSALYSLCPDQLYQIDRLKT